MTTLARQAVLGVWDGHDAGVAVIADGALAFALSEERPSRVKRQAGFPRQALAAALAWMDERGIAPRHLAVAGGYGRLPLRLADPLYRRAPTSRDPLGTANRGLRAYENTVSGLPGLRRVERALGLGLLAARLSALGLRAPTTHVVDHHEAHAAAARFGRHDGDASILTWDAYGEGRSGTWRSAAPAGRAPGVSVGGRAALAELYGAVTVALGFEEGEEGKVMGLAAQGAPERARRRVLDLFERRGGWPTLRRALSRARIERLCAGLPRQDVAAGLQAAVEELAVDGVQARLDAAPSSRLLLGGGLFANILVNLRLAETPGVGGVYVFPHMGDGGLAAGAAHHVWRRLTSADAAPEPAMALGLAFAPEACLRAARAAGLACEAGVDVGVRAARRIAAGQVVALFQGRDEFGPRALGRRSVLFSAARPELAARVNQALGRDPIMPFGPMVAAEDAADLWLPPGDDPDLSTMTMAVRARPRFAARCPVAVHVDGTSRPQLVRASDEPMLHDLLARVKTLSGQPAVINTSFNLHGEPIVHRPEDALATFARAGFEALYLEDVEVRRADVVD